MTARAITRTILECDGCGAIAGANAEFDNVVEARAGAYTLGWRFPSKVNTKGRTMRFVSDVCPDCVPNWQTAVLKAQTWTPEQHKTMAAHRARREARK